jgi:hypothetical protein
MKTLNPRVFYDPLLGRRDRFGFYCGFMATGLSPTSCKVFFYFAIFNNTGTPGILAKRSVTP